MKRGFALLWMGGCLLWSGCQPSPSAEAKSAKLRTERTFSLLESTLIDKIEFEGVSDVEALDFILKQVRRRNGDLQYAFDHTAEAATRKITVHLKNVPALEAIKLVCGLSGREFDVLQGVLAISEGGHPLQRPSVEAVIRFESGHTLVPAEKRMESLVDMRAILNERGLRLDERSSASFAPNQSKLLLRATQRDIDLLKSLDEPLRAPPRHIPVAGSYRYTAPSLKGELPMTWILNLFSDGRGDLWGQPLGARTAPISKGLKWESEDGEAILHFDDRTALRCKLIGYNLKPEGSRFGTFRRFIEDNGRLIYLDGINTD